VSASLSQGASVNEKRLQDGQELSDAAGATIPGKQEARGRSREHGMRGDLHRLQGGGRRPPLER